MHSTNVECAGQCLTKSICTAFEYKPDTKSCQLLEADYLYRDKFDTSALDIYVDVNKMALKGFNLI